MLLDIFVTLVSVAQYLAEYSEPATGEPVFEAHSLAEPPGVPVPCAYAFAEYSLLSTPVSASTTVVVSASFAKREAVTACWLASVADAAAFV